jgi:beta-galactosidase
MSPSGALALNNTQITISYKGKTATVAIEVKPALTEISITKMPNELHYVEGEKFNASGMVVQALYNDGSTQEVTGYTCTPDTT